MNSIFPCVNYGTNANKFLTKCGIKDKPSPADFAQLLVTSSCELWNLYKKDIKKYLNILEKIDKGFNDIYSVTGLYNKLMPGPAEWRYFGKEHRLYFCRSNQCYR